MLKETEGRRSEESLQLAAVLVLAAAAVVVVMVVQLACGKCQVVLDIVVDVNGKSKNVSCNWILVMLKKVKSGEEARATRE